jgi:hypothetical protein
MKDKFISTGSITKPHESMAEHDDFAGVIHSTTPAFNETVSLGDLTDFGDFVRTKSVRSASSVTLKNIPDKSVDKPESADNQKISSKVGSDLSSELENDDVVDSDIQSASEIEETSSLPLMEPTDSVPFIVNMPSVMEDGPSLVSETTDNSPAISAVPVQLFENQKEASSEPSSRQRSLVVDNPVEQEIDAIPNSKVNGAVASSTGEFLGPSLKKEINGMPVSIIATWVFLSLLLLAIIASSLIYVFRRKRRRRNVKIDATNASEFLGSLDEECQSPDVECFINRFDDGESV